MPNSLIHVAGAALALHATGLRGRDRALLALVAILPDLDVVTAIPWLLGAGHLPLPADALFTGTWLFGHRGFSHTLLAAALAAGAVHLWKRDPWWTLGTGVSWASHVLLDAVTPWPTTPLWPFSELAVQRPLITTLDPLLTVASLVAVAALLGPVLAHRVPKLSAKRARRWASWGEKNTARSLVAVGLVGLLTVTPLPLTAWATGTPFQQVHPDGFPRTIVLSGEDHTWRIEQRWHPWDEAEVTVVARISYGNGTGAGLGDDFVSRTACTLDRLGPYSLAQRVAWTVSREDREITVRAVDPLRNATGEGGGGMTFTYQDRTLERIEVGGGQDDGRGFQIALPQPVVEAAACP